MTEKEEKYYESIKSTFVGRSILDIYYEEINWETDGTEFWELTTSIHSVDMNVIFRLDNNELIQIKWDNEFYCYGIGFEKIAKLNHREGFKTISLTQNPNWKSLVNKTITGVVVLWDQSYSQEALKIKNSVLTKIKTTPVKIPLTWQIEFGDDKVWISALEIREDDDTYYWADNLTLLFTEKGQEKYQLINKASTQQRLCRSGKFGCKG